MPALSPPCFTTLFPPAYGHVLSHPSLSLAPVVHTVAPKWTNVLILQATELYISFCVREVLRLAHGRLGFSHGKDTPISSFLASVFECQWMVYMMGGAREVSLFLCNKY